MAMSSRTSRRFSTYLPARPAGTTGADMLLFDLAAHQSTIILEGVLRYVVYS